MEMIKGKVLDSIEITNHVKENIKEKMDQLYDLGIIHEDMHGGNFIIEDKTREAFILDFGSASIGPRVDPMDRSYTIQLKDASFVTVGTESERVRRKRSEFTARIRKMSQTVHKVQSKIREIDELKSRIEKYESIGNTKMANVFRAVLNKRMNSSN